MRYGKERERMVVFFYSYVACCAEKGGMRGRWKETERIRKKILWYLMIEIKMRKKYVGLSQCVKCLKA